MFKEAGEQARPGVAASWGLLLALLFILYETLLPFAFNWSSGQLHEGWQRATLIPFEGPGGRAAGRADIIGNVLLFIPWGFFLTLYTVSSRRPRRWPLLVAGGLLLSLCVELLQLWSPYRFAQTTDLINNTLGTLTGVVLAAAGGARLFAALKQATWHRLRRDPLSCLLVALTAIILLESWLPLDLSISSRSLDHQLDALRWGLGARPPGSAQEPGGWLLLLKTGWLYGCWGVVACRGLRRRRFPGLSTSGLALLLAGTAEAGKLLVVSRQAALSVALAGWCGGSAGAALLLMTGLRTMRDRRLGSVVGAGYLLFLVAETLGPSAPLLLHSLQAGTWQGAAQLHLEWLLEPATDHPDMDMVLGGLLAMLAYYLPLGLGLQLFVPGRRRPVLLLCALIGSLLLELAAGRLGPWPAQMAHVILAWAGIAAGWSLGHRLQQEEPGGRLEPDRGRDPDLAHLRRPEG